MGSMILNISYQFSRCRGIWHEAFQKHLILVTKAIIVDMTSTLAPAVINAKYDTPKTKIYKWERTHRSLTFSGIYINIYLMYA